MVPSSQFPKDFLWGASTASHQVEGGTDNQWSEWENLHAARLAAQAPKNLGWLPNFESIRSQATRPDNYISGKGVEHYHRYEEDFSILESLHMNAFRFGIEWSRIEPEEGVWDEQAIAHYGRYIQALRDRNIQPIPTLWHWTIPRWFAGMGGFEHKRNLRYFKRFVERIAKEYAKDLPYCITLNEPNVYTSFSYVTGEWPPQKKQTLKGLRVYQNLVQAHKIAYGVLKAHNPSLQIGIAAQLSDMRVVNNNNSLNKIVVNGMRYGWNWWFLDRVKRQVDFMGVNYYFTEYRDQLGRLRNPQEPVSDLGWYMQPEGIQRVLEQTWARYHKPLLITENGLADGTDRRRKWWISQTLTALQASIDQEVKLIGYLHWSLLDNFEWAYGWWPKFGLVAVDRTTMQRTIRPSAHWLADQIAKHSRTP